MTKSELDYLETMVYNGTETLKFLLTQPPSTARDKALMQTLFDLDHNYSQIPDNSNYLVKKLHRMIGYKEV